MAFSQNQQNLIDRAEEARAARAAAEQLQRAAVAAGTFSERIRYAMIPSLTRRATSAAASPVTVFTAMAAKVTAVLGPLGMLASVLGATSSGFGTFVKTVQVLGATLAPILLPGFALLGAAVLTLGDYIHEQLQPVLKEWMTWVMVNGIEGIKAFIDALKEAGKKAKENWDMLRDPTGWKREAEKIDNRLKPSELAEVINFAKEKEMGRASAAGITDKKDLERIGNEGARRIGNTDPIGDLKRLATEKGWFGQGGRKSWWDGGPAKADPVKPEADPKFVGPPKPEPKKDGWLPKFIGNMDKYINELQRSIGPQASFQSLSGQSRSVQLAALNQNSFEATMLQRAAEAIGAIREAIGEVRKVNLGAGA